MKILIIEDEKLAAERLIDLIHSYDANYQVVENIDSVEWAVSWLGSNPSPDLIFLDIHLADGNAFEIFDHVEVKSPIIFSTAYDQYAIQAFKVNSVDYLLKPVEKTDLHNALEKLKKQLVPQELATNIGELIQSFQKKYKSRFVTKVGEHLHAIETDRIHFFFSEEKATYLQTNEGKRYLVDFPLDKIESMVNPTSYFRINRKYLVSFPSIQDILTHSNSRLRLKLTNSNDTDVIVSREKVQEFKSWLDV